MTERKKKSQVEDNVPRSSLDNFTNIFLALCEKYDVDPLPKLCHLGISSIAPETSRQTTISSEDKTPIIYTSYENSKLMENIQKFECKGYKISVCILDALTLSIRKFDTVTTIRLPNCGINAFGISQIAQILTEVGCVRDLNLDSNPNIRENYHLLCNPSGKLMYLSLKYCNISDVGIESIANELKYQVTEDSPQLIGLDLANNCINDIGAGHIARMLHTNRSLQSLILTGNRISDSGADLIVRELCMYPVVHDEVVELRRLNYARLMQRESRLPHAVSELNNQERSSRNLSSKLKGKTTRRSVSSRKSTNSKPSIGGKFTATIKETDNETDTTNAHPLTLESRPVRGNIVATGNFELQHLNLSYNHLTDESLKKIVNCIFYQSYMMLGDTSKGLLFVYLEGNDFKIEGNENWKNFQESLVVRRSSESRDDKLLDYDSAVSIESQNLREKLKVGFDYYQNVNQMA